MSENNNNFNETVSSLFKGMDSFISTKTVVGEAVKFDDGTIIVPFVDVSFGVGAGAFQGGSGSRNSAGGGMGGKISPNSVLVIQDGHARIVTINSADTVSKLFDMVPEVVDKVKGLVKDKKRNEEMDKKGEEFIKEQMEK